MRSASVAAIDQSRGPAAAALRPSPCVPVRRAPRRIRLAATRTGGRRFCPDPVPALALPYSRSCAQPTMVVVAAQMRGRKAVGARDTAAFEVRDALGHAGCPICVLTTRSVGRLLKAVAYEQVNDI